MQTQIKRVESALNALRQGKMIVLTDDPYRENEGDLVLAAEYITTDKMNFIIRNSSGIVCLAASAAFLKKFHLHLMVAQDANTSNLGTPFTVSIDAKQGITTGVSAADRTLTIQTLLHNNAGEHDLVKPGHVFPLQAQDQGVFARQGHTEGAVDLVKLIACKPAAVLCELMNTDGTMMRGKQLQEFANLHNLVCLSIDDIITYRKYHETSIVEQAHSSIPLESYGDFELSVFKEKVNNKEHVALFKKNNDATKPTLVRVHSSCLTGDLFSSKRCDCNKQLHYSLQRISEEGGVLIYLNQEGRGIGLLNKIKAYALQDKGYDTVDANLKLGLQADARDYSMAANILKSLNIDTICLLTNNPLKVKELKQWGITNVEREGMPVFSQEHNAFYLQTKKNKLQHRIELE